MQLQFDERLVAWFTEIVSNVTYGVAKNGIRLPIFHYTTDSLAASSLTPGR